MRDQGVVRNLAGEGNKTLAETDTDGLEVLGLPSSRECLDCLLPTPPRAREERSSPFGDRHVVLTRDPDREANVEGEYDVSA